MLRPGLLRRARSGLRAAGTWDSVIDGLLAAGGAGRATARDLDADLFAPHVQRAAAVSTMPFLRGVFLGVLTEMRRMEGRGAGRRTDGLCPRRRHQQVWRAIFCRA